MVAFDSVTEMVARRGDAADELLIDNRVERDVRGDLV